MLVLTRKERETIRIGDDVTITVKRIDGNRVRIGVSAPAGVDVLRGELLDEANSMRLFFGTDTGKDATRKATQARTDPQQDAD